MMGMHPDTIWLYSEWFYLIPLLIVVYVWKWKRSEAKLQGLKYPDVAKFKNLSRGLWAKSLWWRRLPDFVRLLVLSALVVALARPRWGQDKQSIETHGVDMILGLDVSGSMGTLDLMSQSLRNKIKSIDPDDFYKSGRQDVHSRLGVAKRVLDSFIEQRPGDRMGLVIFAGEAQTQVPLTTDGKILRDILKEVSKNSVLVPRTAIGDALMVAVSRLKESPSPERLIILLTDGANNEGQVAPLKAASVAKALGIRIYTVGVGKKSGTFLQPGRSFFGGLVWQEQEVDKQSGVDEVTLTKIAEETGGRYYRASNKEELAKIYGEIDQLEKTEFKENQWVQYHEQFLPWVYLSFCLLILEFSMRWTYWRSTL